MEERRHPTVVGIAWALLCGLGFASDVAAADWPQFMHDAGHTANAADERLAMPLSLQAQVRLDDAIMTSPAVVSGRVYVVDQMGTAYCLDLRTSRILWRVNPEGEAAFGSNTSSPCVVQGRLVYGTTAGNVHLLDAESGRVIRSLSLGWPIVSAITQAGDSLYVHTLGAVVHCLDLDGNDRWRWDHYGSVDGREAPADTLRSHGENSPHYGGNPVAVSGDKVVTTVGYDLVCLVEVGAEARLAWRGRWPDGATHAPQAIAISEGYVYTGWPGSDGAGAVTRHRLADGALDRRRDVLTGQWAVLTTPAVRGKTVYFGRQAFGVAAHRFEGDRSKGYRWASFDDRGRSLTPCLASPALSNGHCLFTTLNGELVGVELAGAGTTPGVFRFATPNGKASTSSPAISDGRVFFGCDDGYLYVLGNGAGIEPNTAKPTLHQRKRPTVPATGRTYAWPSSFGGPRNACFVDDPAMKPPFRLRWAVRSGGLFKQPVCATRDDIVYSTLGGLVVCREQLTGRVRWRRKLDEQAWTRAGLLCADGKIYVIRAFSPRYPKVAGHANALYCLDAETGGILWQRPIGITDRLRASPVFADGVVAYGSLHRAEDAERPLIEPQASWRYLAGSDPQEDWTSPAFEAQHWPLGEAGFGYGDDDDRTVLAMQGKYRRVYLRKELSVEQVDDLGSLTLVVNYDDAFIAYLNGREIARAGVGTGRGKEASGIRLHEANGYKRLPVADWRGLLTRGTNVLCIEGHNAKLDSSDFTLDPYLIARRRSAPLGQVVQAWEANSGRPLWHVAINGRGKALNGPAGCVGEGVMYFAGGGEGSGSEGETVALAPRAGRVLWRTSKAFASRSGAPAFQGGRLYLPGAHQRPLTCLSAATGEIIWQRHVKSNGVYRDFVHAPSLGPDYFTVNNKYRGGAKLWNLSQGTLVGAPAKPIQLFGNGHGCGSVVLTSGGLALSATVNGLFAVEARTGKPLWHSLGFAPRACPNPIVSNGRIFYAPQVNGMLYCFGPEQTR